VPGPAARIARDSSPIARLSISRLSGEGAMRLRELGLVSRCLALAVIVALGLAGCAPASPAPTSAPAADKPAAAAPTAASQPAAPVSPAAQAAAARTGRTPAAAP